jgi:kynureninase
MFNRGMNETTVFAAARKEAARLDAADPLAGFRSEFRLPCDLYFCGHSLGPQPIASAEQVARELRAWAELGVEGHFRPQRPWGDYTPAMDATSARLVGAEPDEVAVMHSLGVNLHLMLASLYRPRGERARILIERPAFPSDRYAVVSHLQWHGLRTDEALVEVGPRAGETTVRQEDLLARIETEGPRLALALIGAANYITGQVFDLAACAHAAHRVGALAGFDLAHAVGNVPLALDAAEADFAVWCGYKYLNGGPGAPAGVFVHRRHFAAGVAPRPRLAGWWGNRADTRFAMRPDFEPEAGAAGWAVSCPSILSLSALDAALAMFARAPLEAMFAKSRALVAIFDRLADAQLSGLQRVTPRDAAARGGQVSLGLADAAAAAALQQRLRAAGLVCDTRGPILRVSFHPLYHRYVDAVRCIEALHHAWAARATALHPKSTMDCP